MANSHNFVTHIEMSHYGTGVETIGRGWELNKRESQGSVYISVCFSLLYRYNKLYNQNLPFCRRGTSSGHPPPKKPLTGKATFLPKLEQSMSNSVTHISTQSAKQATAAVDSVISLPKINSSCNTLLSQNPSDSDIQFKRLTIQIPSASGDNVHIPHSTTREKLPPKVSSSYHHSNTNSRVQSTASSSLSSKSRNRSLTEQLSDHSLLAPICNSYGGASQPTRQKSDEELIEGPPHKSSKANNEKPIEGSPRRKSSKGDSTSVHSGVHHSEDSEKDEGMISLAVMPTTGNLSASRFNGTSSLHSLPPSMGGARRLRRGSLVMPGDKPMKTCISLRVSPRKLYSTDKTCTQVFVFT